MSVQFRIEMDDKTAQVIGSMRDHVGAKSTVELIKWSLSIYGFLLKLQDREGAVLVQEEGELKKLDMKPR